ncbi:MAG TPA: sigma-70 family RNA polymerase sigma factor [Phycisphaerae bacterium]|nr:sigma-70 family RNA polymerase sigma factor [Phycisphaerae bacterium]
MKLPTGGRKMLRPADFPETRPSLLAKLGAEAPSQSAWREFFERYAPAVYRVARFRGLAGEDCDDIVQQVMLSMATHLSRFEYDRDRGRFRNWIRTVTENKIRELRRRRKLPEVDLEPEHEPAVDRVWQQEWHLQDLLWCLDQVALEVSPRRMATFKLYSLNGLPAAEVARQMSTSVGYVYVTRHLVLNLVREKAKLLSAEE